MAISILSIRPIDVSQSFLGYFARIMGSIEFVSPADPELW